MLIHAAKSYNDLKEFLKSEIKGLQLAYTYLTIK